MPDHNNHGFSSNHRPNGSSHNNKTTKVDPKDAKIDSLNDVIKQLSIQNTQYFDSIGMLKDSKKTLEKTLEMQVGGFKKKEKMMNETKDSLIRVINDVKSEHSPVTFLTSPYGCSIIIVFILALTIIALKKGFSVSKGNTSISVGDKK